MKITKMLVIMFLAVAAVSCNKDDDGPEPFVLSNANLAGTYKISSLNASSTSTTNVSGATVTVATATVVGDTFQVNIVFNTNGTYTAIGNYRITSTITPTGSDPIVETEILTVDSSGSYSVNATTQKITMTPSDDSFVDGTFEVTLFNQSNVNLAQEDVSVEGGITTTTIGTINLVKQ